MGDFKLTEPQVRVVQAILKKYGIRAYVFGSRAKGVGKKLSDLDLVVRDPLSRQKIQQIKDEFEESDLPFKVDLLNWNNLDEEFKRLIEGDLILFRDD